MCGIVGAVAERNVTAILLEGLKRLEYRGYDSAGLAVIDAGQIHRERRSGKVRELEQAAQVAKIHGHIGIAHTRWATHGALKIMLIRTFRVMLPWYIMALSKIMKSYAVN